MNEEKKVKNELQEVVTPEQTGEIVQHEVATPKATKEAISEVQEPAKDTEQVKEVPSKVEQDSEDVGEKQEEDTRHISDGEEKSKTTDKDTEEVHSEETADETVEEQPKNSEESEKQQDEEKKKEKSPEEPEEADIEQLKRKLEELEAEKEDAAKVRELVETAHKAEVEYNKVVNGINEALRETLEQYQIPTDKTIEELEHEDPAKARIARELIAQAKQTLDFNTQRLSEQYKQKERDVVFTKAEKLFNKYDLTNEQSKVAATTFISIINTTGLQDLNEDLAAKVELSVAQAKFKFPDAIPTEPQKVVEPIVEQSLEEEANDNPEVVQDVDVDETQPEDKAKEKEKKNVQEFEIQKGVAKVAPVRPDVSAYKEGIEGSNSTAASVVKTTDSQEVLHKLAKLPFRERQKFLKENFAEINKAMKEVNLKFERKI